VVLGWMGKRVAICAEKKKRKARRKCGSPSSSAGRTTITLKGDSGGKAMEEGGGKKRPGLFGARGRGLYSLRTKGKAWEGGIRPRRQGGGFALDQKGRGRLTIRRESRLATTAGT